MCGWVHVWLWEKLGSVDNQHSREETDAFQNTDQWWPLDSLPGPSGQGQAPNSQSS